MKANRSIVVIYEEPITRRHAVAFCDQLAERFAHRCLFDTVWWSFSDVGQILKAEEAARKATQADWIIFAARPDGEIPAAVANWIEVWLGRRGREGVLVGLIASGPAADEAARKHTYFRHVAHRGGMDYLTQVPESAAHPMSDSIESYTERADQVTSVLDGILRRPLPPVVLRS